MKYTLRAQNPPRETGTIATYPLSDNVLSFEESRQLLEYSMETGLPVMFQQEDGAPLILRADDYVALSLSF
jgi:hypothetical protein